MTKLSRAAIVLVAIVVLFFGVRAWRASAQAELEKSQNVTIIVSPSVQPGKGQGVLFKLTNISGRPVGIRLNLFNDTEAKPVETTDFRAMEPKVTIAHLYVPPPAALVLNGTTFDAPAAVRALIEPLPGGEPAALRRVVVSLLVVGLKPAMPNAPPPTLDPPTIVPLERCMFASRGMAPYTGMLTGLRQVWDCAQAM